jgi:general secretion pathway protein D
MGSLTTDQLRMVMQALRVRDNSKVVSCPTIVTLNRKAASVGVDTSYPVRRETVVTTNTGPVTSVSYDKTNVKVSLDVTPAINPDGYITMEVNPQVQSVVGRVDNTQPIVSTKESKTNIIVRNGHTIVIAGLIEETRSLGNTEVPIIHRVPLIGKLFQSSAESRTRSETIIFITPRIVDGGVPTKGTTVPRVKSAPRVKFEQATKYAEMMGNRRLALAAF